MEGLDRHETKEMRIPGALIHKNEKSIERRRQTNPGPSASEDDLLLQTMVVPFREREYAVLLHPVILIQQACSAQKINFL